MTQGFFGYDHGSFMGEPNSNATPSDPPGTRIAGRYRVVASLGRGGMGRVYLAIDETTGQRMALKRALFPKDREAKLSPLFEREYQTLAALDHPAIIRVFDFGRDERGPYYTMELLEGQDLRELSPLPYRDACRYLRDIASSIALLHARQLVHRDVSPANVRVAGDDRAKLLDFGALAPFGPNKDVIGTPPCIPPEAVRGKILDQRSDLYAFGALLYYALTGRHAYPSRDIAGLHIAWQTPPPAPSAIVPEVPEALDELVLSLLSLEAIGRPHSAAAVIDQLTVIADLSVDGEHQFAEAHLRSAVLVGRERELRKLGAYLESFKQNDAKVLLISGPSGIGKTRLLSELTLRAQMKAINHVHVAAESHRQPYGVARKLAMDLLDLVPEVALRAVEPHAAVLGHVLPELSERVPGITLEKLPKAGPERRARLQRALGDWLATVTTEVPVFFTVDNAELADDGSIALLASLARKATPSPLVIVLTIDPSHARAAALQSLVAADATFSPAPLSGANVEQLVRGLFDGAENAPRLARAIHERSGGNPGHCLDLVRHLIREGHIEYADGAWTLPQELRREDVPNRMEDVLLASFQRLEPSTREVASRLSISRVALATSLIAKLTDSAEANVLRQLDVLVQAEIITGVDGTFRIASDAFRARLLEDLDASLKLRLHELLANALLEVPNDADLAVESGYQLMQSGQALAGARRMSEAAFRTAMDRGYNEDLVAAMELALGAFEKFGAAESECLLLRAALAAASYSLDHRLATRHGTETMRRLRSYLGFTLATRLSPFIGAKLALKVGSFVAVMRHGLHKRPMPELVTLYQSTFMAWLSLLGVAAICLDRNRIGELLEPMRIIKAYGPRSFGAYAFNMGERMYMQTSGCEYESQQLSHEALALLRDPRVVEGMGPGMVQSLRGGVLFGLGLAQTFRADDSAMKTVQALRGLGLAMYDVVAEQIAMVAHAYRGESQLARQCQQRVETLALQGGTTWQTEIFIPANLLIAHYLAGDVVALKHARQQLLRRGAEVPSIMVFGQFSAALIQLSRGRYSEALELLEQVKREVLPRQRNGWAMLRAAIAIAYTGVGQPERARQLCLETLAMVRPTDMEFPLGYVHVARELARAEAALGDHAGAARRIDELLQEHAKHDAPLLLGLLHRDATQLALGRGDQAAAERHIERAREYFRTTTNDALIATGERLAARVNRKRPGPTALSPEARAQATERVRTLLETADSPTRAQIALDTIAQSTGARAAFLVLFADDKPYVAAALQGDAPPSILDASAALRSSDADSVTETADEDSIDGSTSAEASTAIELAADDTVLPLRPMVLRGAFDEVIGVAWLALLRGQSFTIDTSLFDAVADALSTDAASSEAAMQL